MENKFDIVVNFQGGDPNGQAGAIRHGITRALMACDEAGTPFMSRSHRKSIGQRQFDALGRATEVGLPPNIADACVAAPVIAPPDTADTSSCG
jgi:hypothetical protein